MSDRIVVRRRRRRATPMRTRRLTEWRPAATAPEGFPGEVMPEPEGLRGQLASGGVSLLLHGSLLLSMLLAAWLAPQETVEEVIRIKPLPDEIAQEESAPRPKVLAESLGRFNPAPMALPSQVVNPAVIQRRTAVVAARKVQVDTVSPVQAPRNVERASRHVDTVRAYQSVAAATAQPVAVESLAPALAGPLEPRIQSGTQSGPRQVVPTGSTVGRAGPQALGSGSSVREGIASSRDVLGGREGVRAQVNWAVGAGGGRGLGGHGTGPGGVTFEQCTKRPEVQRYMARIKSRVMARWVLPVDAASNLTVQLRFVLDPAGSAQRVEFVGGSPVLGESAVDAMRSASPFDQMPDRVRCLAGYPLVATFRNPVAAN